MKNGDALPPGDAADCLTEKAGDRHDFDLGRQLDRLRLDTVGHEELFDRAGVEPLDCRTGEKAVSDGGVNRGGATLDEHSSGFGEGAC